MTHVPPTTHPARRNLVRLVALVGLVAVTIPACSSSSAGASGHPGAPAHLTIDDEVDPVGVDDARPAFAWLVTDPRPGAIQSSYRIVVSRAGRMVWDSGRVRSGAQSEIDYGGPTLPADQEFRWTVQTWDGAGERGPASTPATFVTGLGDHDWQADWITRASNDPLDATDAYTYARHDFRVGSSPVVRATAYVSADQQYQLHLDGRTADAGQAYSYPDSQYYQATDVTPRVRAGSTLAVGLLSHWSGVGKGRPAGQPGMVAEISVWHADGSHQVLGTDGSWKVTRAPWLAGRPRNLQGDPVDNTENLDGLHAPQGWDEPGFDAATWAPAQVIGRPPVAPWTHLVDSRTRIVTKAAVARTLTRLPGGAYVADFGSVVAATPTVAFHQGQAGRLVTMHAGYLLDPDGSVSTTRGTQATDLSYSYLERAGTQTFAPFDYLGFRYLQIDDLGEVLHARDVVAQVRHVELPAGPYATFSSSDPTLDAIWAMAAHSGELTAQEQFIDTPTREKGPFLRDGFNESETDMAAFGEQNLTRRALLEFAQSQSRYWPDGRLNAIYPSGQGARDIPDFTEIYPEWVWRYWMATGDRQLLAAVYPVLTRIADYLRAAIDPATGLVTNLPGGDGDYQYGIVDWPAPMRYGYDMATAARTTVNVMAVDALDRTANAGAALGRPASELAGLRASASSLTTAINARLTRADGTYVDGLEADATPSHSASEHANAEALAFDVVPTARRASVAAYVASLGTQMGPMTAQALLDALHQGGQDPALVALLTNPAQPGWANILAQGATFTWETWAPSDADGDSLSHGWGATVLVALQEDLAGVTLTGAGGSSVAVRAPRPGPRLSRLRATVPTPRGVVSVSWRFAGNGAVTLDLTVPPNTTASVVLDGQPVQRVGAGHHRFTGSG